MKLYQKPKFLSENEMQKIHEASVYILEKKCVVFKSKEAVAYFKERGCVVEGKKVFIPSALIDECLKQTPSKFRIHAVNPEHSFTVGEGLIIHPAGGEVFLTRSENTPPPASMNQQ